MTPVIWLVLILVASAVCIAILVVYAARLDGNGGHTHRNIRLRDDAPAGPADPDGERPSPDLDALTPGPVGGGWLEALPDDDPADITGVQTPAVCYLGTDLDQYVNELFDKHAAEKS